MKTETVDQYIKRGGIIKECRPAKARGLYVRKYDAQRHMSKSKPEPYMVKHEIKRTAANS